MKKKIKSKGNFCLKDEPALTELENQVEDEEAILQLSLLDGENEEDLVLLDHEDNPVDEEVVGVAEAEDESVPPVDDEPAAEEESVPVEDEVNVDSANCCG